jgi:hypothetical protein
MMSNAFEVNNSKLYLLFTEITPPIIHLYVHYITISLNMYAIKNLTLFSTIRCRPVVFNTQKNIIPNGPNAGTLKINNSHL